MNKPTIDWDFCLKQSNNNPKIAKELLSLLAKELPIFKKQLQNADQNKFILDVVHKLHGACCYVGVPKLRELVERTETQLKKDITTDIAQNLLHIIEAIDEVLQEIPALA
jgi:two-component system sensor histidine kinase BarA